VNVDMIVQNTSKEGTTDISFTMPKADMRVAEEIVARVAATSGPQASRTTPTSPGSASSAPA
jgi:aspartate kinase